jgi:hypothetical protein
MARGSFAEQRRVVREDGAHFAWSIAYVRYQTDEGTTLVCSLFSFRILHAPSNKAKVNRNMVNAESKMATELSSKGVISNSVFTSHDVPEKQ